MTRMINIRIWVCALASMLAALVLIGAPGCSHAEKRPQDNPPGVSIGSILEPIRTERDLPAMAAAMVTREGVQRIGAVGVRKRGTVVAVTVDDLFHLGSDTKAMTAMLLAGMVEAGRLRWDVTLSEVFTDLAESMRAEAGAIPLEQLLTHQSGMPSNPPRGWWYFAGPDDVRSQRLAVVRWATSSKFDHRPGESHVYSNLGYVLAGAIAERIDGAAWEELIESHVFEPLGMETAGFGAMGTSQSVEQPWPHNADGEPIPPGPRADNPPVLGPAGRVHCSLADWAKFVADHLKGAAGRGGILQAQTYRTLQTKSLGDRGYTLGGWRRVERPFGVALTHDGSNTLNYATAWMVPERNLAVLVVCNQGGDAARRACHEAARVLLDQHLPTPPK